MQTIEAKNLGPIKDLSVRFDQGYGVYVLRGRNGSGKSIFLDSVAKMASGKGRMPLRDSSRKGMVSGFGATVTIGGTTRHTGEFQVVNLEGRFDLAELVDPGIKSADAADRRRIKALVQLTGTKADRELFTSHEAFSSYSEVVDPEAEETDDLVEMAARVKRCYENRARDQEKTAEREEGHAQGLMPTESLEGQDDATILQEAYDAARDTHTRLVEEKRHCDSMEANREKAKADLARLIESYDGDSVEVCEAEVDRCRHHEDSVSAEVRELRRRLERLEREESNAIAKVNLAEQALKAARQFEDAKNSLQGITNSYSEQEAPTQEAIDDAAEKLQKAREAMEHGALIRDMKKKRQQANEHKANANEARDKAEVYRSTAQCTDEVLSNAIKCDALRVESCDGEARLVVDHPIRGEGIPYHELSHGERWKIAIDLGADQVGEGGLIVVKQEAFEGLQPENKRLIHAHAIERKVFILTGEAVDDPEIEAGRFEG